MPGSDTTDHRQCIDCRNHRCDRRPSRWFGRRLLRRGTECEVGLDLPTSSLHLRLQTFRRQRRTVHCVADDHSEQRYQVARVVPGRDVDDHRPHIGQRQGRPTQDLTQSRSDATAAAPARPRTAGPSQQSSRSVSSAAARPARKPAVGIEERRQEEPINVAE